MASTTFVDGETLIEASWLNDVNAAVYTPGTINAVNVANTPAGNIASTNVQAAINELDSEKQPLDAELTALAALVSAINTVPSFTGSGTAALLTLGTASGNLPLVGTKSATKTLPGLNYDIPQIQPITATVATNALTLTLNPTVLDFRSDPISSGTTNTRIVSDAISLIVPDTATLGTTNGTAARLVLLAIDNSGTVELAIVNDATGNTLDETTLISTTAITTSADSASVIYSTTARTNVPFRVVGFVDITEATAGTWATAPSLIQGIGGQVLVSTGSKSLASSGYYKFPGGLILQWGTTASVANGAGRTATLSIAFPNAAFVGFVMGTIGGGAAEANHVVTALSTTTLTFTNNSTTTQPFYYFAIGY